MDPYRKPGYYPPLPERRRVVPYQYEPLEDRDSIRLLELDPGENRDQLSGRLIKTEIDTRHRYKAISYCWGSDRERDYITLDGDQHKISKNLRNALRAIRSLTQRIFLWVDQICINQKDDRERGRQVQHMAEIFSRASRVFVHLGVEEDATARGALETIRELGDRVDDLSDLHGGFEFIPSTLSLFDRDYDDLDWRSYQALMDCEWFHRTWVVQEVGLAKRVTVIYAGLEIDWAKLMRGALFMMGPGDQLGARYKLRISHVPPIWDQYNPHSPHNSISTFLSSLSFARPLSASNPRDKIYAFLGHPSLRIPKRKPFIIEVHYEWSVAEVYTDFAAQWMTRLKDHSMLNYVKATVDDFHASDEYPSWCPRWDQSPYFLESLAPENARDHYNCGGSYPFDVRVNSRRILMARGFVFDVLRGTSSPFTMHFRLTKENSPTFLDVMDDILGGFGNARDIDESILTELAMALTCGFSRWTDKLPVQSEEDHYLDFCSFIMEQSSIRPPQRSDILRHVMQIIRRNRSNPEGALQFSASASRLCNNRKLAVTRKGYFGLVPKESQPRDVVCVLFGAKTPFVLRPHKNGAFFLVGECYVEGIMHGEAMKMLDRGKFVEEQIDIM